VVEWTEPRIAWLAAADAGDRYSHLERTGERLARWPAAPFEQTPTDCFALGPEYWIWQPGVGGLRFTSTEAAVTAYREPSADPRWFERVVTRSWMPTVYQTWGRQVLHASAVARGSDGRVVAFTGPSGAGKSTLAYSLAQRAGWTQVADDTLAFSVEEGRVRLHPLPNEARLRPSAAEFHGRAAERLEPLEWPAFPLSLGQVYVIGGDDAILDAARVEPLGAAEAYTRLLEQAHAFTLQVPAFNQRLMRDYLTVAARVPTLRLTYRPRFEDLDKVVDRIESEAARLSRR
jgi:hypothetical protein